MSRSMLGILASHAKGFLRRTKMISRLASRSSHPVAKVVGSVANAMGYGRRYRRCRRGGALKLAGMGMGLAGGRRHGRRGLRNLPMAY